MMIGGLFARLSLNSASFEQGVKRARSTMFRMAKDLTVVSAAAAAGGVALGAMGGAAVNSAREVQRLSQVAGAAPRELQRWSAATRTVGIDQEKLADILKDVNDRVGDFVSTGGGPMKDFFENIAPKVGVTADMFAKLSGPEALQLYVDSLQKAGLNQKEMTFYMEAMASDSTLLLPLLKNNAAELNRLGDAAEKAGGIMSDMDVANLAKAGESFDRLRNSAIGMRNVLAAQLAPAMEKLAGVIEKAMQKGGALRRVFEFLGENAGRIASYVGMAAAAFSAYASAVVVATAVTMGWRRALIRTGIGLLVVGLGEAVYQFTRLNSAVGDSGKAFSMIKDLAKGAVNSTVQSFFWLGNRLIGVFRGTFGAIKEIFKAFPPFMRAIAETAVNGLVGVFERGLNSLVNRLNRFIEKVNSAIKSIPEWLGGGDGAAISLLDNVSFAGVGNKNAEAAKAAGSKIKQAFIDGFNKDTGAAPKIFDVPKVSEQWRKIRTTIAGTKKSTDTVTEAATSLDTAFSGIGPAAEEAADGVDKVADALEETLSNVDRLGAMFASTFSSIVTKSSSAKAAVSGLLSKFADMVANRAFQGLWSETIGSSISGGGMSWLGNAANFLFGGLGGHATGTPSSSGGLKWVGERGPELMHVQRGTKVYDSQRSERMMNGGGNSSVRISLEDGLRADILDQARGQSIDIVQSGLDQFSRDALPQRMGEISNDPRRIG